MLGPPHSVHERPWAPIGLKRWRPAWLRRDLLYLLIGRALRSVAQGYLLIIVPLYLALLGFDAVHLGILFAATAVASAILVAAIGLLSDRFGRKSLLILISLMTAGGGLVFAFSTNYIVLVLGAALGTIGRGGGAGSGGAWGPYFPAEQALIAEQAPDRQRTMVFGVLSFVGVLASAVGSLLAYAPDLLRHIYGIGLIDGYRALFFLTAILGVGMALVVIPVRERHQPVAHPQHLRHPHPHPAGALPPKRILGTSVSRESWRLIVRFMMTNSINGLAVGMLGPFVVYWFYRCYGVSSGQLGTLFFFINLIAAAPYLGAGYLARRLGAVGAVVITRTCSITLLVVLALMPTFAWAAFIYAIRTVFNTLSLPVRQSYLMGVIHPSERATAAGLANFPSQVSASITPYFAGYFMQHIALSLPLECAAGLMAINTTLYYLFFKSVRPPEEMEIVEEMELAGDGDEP